MLIQISKDGIFLPYEQLLKSTQDIVFSLLNWGFQVANVYYTHKNHDEYLALQMLDCNGYINNRSIGLKTIKLIAEVATELNIKELPQICYFGYEDSHVELVKIVADRILKACLSPQ